MRCRLASIMASWILGKCASRNKKRGLRAWFCVTLAWFGLAQVWLLEFLSLLCGRR